MDTPEFDTLLTTYKGSVESLISAIRAEESLATTDHCIVAMERWDQAINIVREREDEVNKARCNYQDALRQTNYRF